MTVPPDSPEIVWQACVRHRDMMYRVCLRILRNRHDAEDAVEAAIAAAIAQSHTERVRNWESWLYRIAENAAKQHLRTEAGQRARQRETLPRAEDDDRLRELEIERLVTRATAMLDPGEQCDLALYQEVALHGLTQREVAKKHDLSLGEVRRRRRRGARTAKAAIIAVYLAEHPGAGDARCAGPRRLAGDADSPESRARITRHILGCATCRPKHDKPEQLLTRLLAVAGVGLTTGLLARLLTTKKVALAATMTVAAVTVAVLVDDERPAPPDVVLVPPPPRQAVPAGGLPPTASTASTSPAPSATRPSPTAERPVPRQQLPAPAPDPAPAPVPVQRPAIAGGWVEYRRLALDDGGRCDDDAQETSGVGALVRNADEVTVHLRDEGRDIVVGLVDVGHHAWGGELGPFGADVPAGRYDVVVEAVGTGGAPVTKKIAELCLFPCGGGRP